MNHERITIRVNRVTKCGDNEVTETAEINFVPREASIPNWVPSSDMTDWTKRDQFKEAEDFTNLLWLSLLNAPKQRAE